jgi:hypothetical protein
MGVLVDLLLTAIIVIWYVNTKLRRNEAIVNEKSGRKFGARNRRFGNQGQEARAAMTDTAHRPISTSAHGPLARPAFDPLSPAEGEAPDLARHQSVWLASFARQHPERFVDEMRRAAFEPETRRRMALGPNH